MRLLVCILILFLINPCFAFNFKKRKKIKPTKTNVVETRQEWEIKAQSIPLEDRELEVTQEPKTDKKNYFPKAHYNFERYNYPAGKRDYDIRFIKKNLVEHPIIVADKECKYVAYANYYYRMDIDQIYSDFFVEKLDSSKTKTKRILEYNHKQLARTPILLSGFKEQYNHLFSGLSLVDWSADSKKVLIKEQVGSTVGGIYKTNLYVYFLESEKSIKLSNFTDAIINYYLDIKNLQLVKYRYTLEPLGFSAENDSFIVAKFYVYDNDGNKMFLGLWGYDLEDNQTLLMSKTNPSTSISANGLVLKRVLE